VSGVTEYIPNGNVFLVGAIVVAFSLIPIIMTMKYRKTSAALSAGETIKEEK
jgi:hypothetical protein